MQVASTTLKAFGRRMATWSGHTDRVVSLTAGGGWLFSGTADGTIKVWDTAKWECVRTIQAPEKQFKALYYQDGLLFAAYGCSYIIKVWDIATWDCIHTLQGDNSVINSLTVKDKYVISGSKDNSIRVWSTATWQCVRTLKGHTGCVCCLVVGEGWMASGSADKTIKIWDTTTWDCYHTVEHFDCVKALAVGDGVLFSSGSIIKVWNTTSWTCVHTLNALGS